MPRNAENAGQAHFSFYHTAGRKRYAAFDDLLCQGIFMMPAARRCITAAAARRAKADWPFI